MRADRFCRTTTTSIIRVSSILLLLKNKNPTTNLFRQSNSTTPYYILLLVPNVDFRGPRCVLLRGGPVQHTKAVDSLTCTHAPTLAGVITVCGGGGKHSKHAQKWHNSPILDALTREGDATDTPTAL